VDVHNSPACDNGILVSNNKFASAYIRFAIKNGLHYMLCESETDTIKRYAVYSGNIGFTVELGGMAFAPGFKDVIEKQTEFVFKLLQALDCTSRSEFISSSRTLPAQYNMINLHAHYQGIVKHNFAPGDTIKKGEVVFDILNPTTTYSLESVVAPCDCFLSDCEVNLWSTAGMQICSVQPIIPPEVVNA
jgi:predicted deacylase